MPRSFVAFAELPEDERGIGQRLRRARTQRRLSQAQLAAVIGLTRDQLASVEVGRVALRFEPGWQACAELNLNPLWLAFCEGETRGFVDVITEDIYGDVLFSDIMRSMSVGEFTYADWRAGRMKSAQGKMVLSNVAPLTSAIKNVNPQLTNPTGLLSVRRMKLRTAALWPRLRERIRKAVRKRGMKAALARDVGLTRQAVNSLLSLSHPYTPSAEYALRLEQWVTSAEAQNQLKKASLVHEHKRRPRPKQGKSGK